MFADNEASYRQQPILSFNPTDEEMLAVQQMLIGGEMEEDAFDQEGQSCGDYDDGYSSSYSSVCHGSENVDPIDELFSPVLSTPPTPPAPPQSQLGLTLSEPAPSPVKIFTSYSAPQQYHQQQSQEEPQQYFENISVQVAEPTTTPTPMTDLRVPPLFSTQLPPTMEIVSGGFEIKRLPGEVWLLWKFLLQLLLLPNHYGHIIRWTFQNDWEFIILDHKQLIDLWMKAKNRVEMKDDSLLRSLRYYYQKGYLVKHPNEKSSKDIHMFNPSGPIFDVLGEAIINSPMKAGTFYHLYQQNLFGHPCD